MSELEAAQARFETAKALRILAGEKVKVALALENFCCSAVIKARMELVAIQDTLNYEI